MIELKAVPFELAFVGQLNLYFSAADDLLRHPEDKPSIGLLLCRFKNKVVVAYALRHLKRPISHAVGDQHRQSLPKEFVGILPTLEEVGAELTAPPKVRLQSRQRKS